METIAITSRARMRRLYAASLPADTLPGRLTSIRQLRLGSGVHDPRRPLLPPKKEQIPPAINFAALENASAKLTESAERYKKALAAAKAKIAGDREAQAALNTKLYQSERQFLAADGLKRRPWFRHMLYAPGYYTGYAVKTMPGVREGIEQKQYADADAEAVKLADVLNKQAAWIDAASEVLEGVK